MTKEIRFSTENMTYSDPQEDCFLDSSDPVHSLKSQGVLGMLTPGAISAAYDAQKQQQIAQQHFQLQDDAKRLGIRPGTPAWFALNQVR